MTALEIVLEVIFSLDLVISAAGLARGLALMIVANVIAVGVMMVAAGCIGDFVDRHPTLKMLALRFMFPVGFTLVAAAMGSHIPRGFIYVALTSFGSV